MTALALCLSAAPLAAQDKPVEQTQLPENEATAPTSDAAGALPPPAPASTAAGAKDAKPAKWDVNAPRGLRTKQVRMTTDEGSWMNVDVSPDGRTLAFDLLGDIYTMPIAGGTPTRIAEGLAFEHQPRFSPDGRRIAFTSDRGGGDNIWVMNVDGSDKRQVTKEDFRLLNQPTWSTDGRFIAAKKHFTTGRSLGTGEVWLYHVSGGGGVQLVKRASEVLQKELGEPIYAPDGKSIYYTRNVSSGPIFEYAQNSRTDLFDIERYDIDSGEVTTAVSGVGGSVRPTPSRDGKMIAFVRRDDNVTKLWVKDLTTGVERIVYGPLDRDVQETWAVTGVYPNMSWTPDDKGIVFWSGGKLRRVGVDGGTASVIPFRVDDTRVIAEAAHPQVEVAPARFMTKATRWATVSPDGKQVVFETLGKLWIKPLAGGAPKRLTRATDELELWPSWSRDGRTIVFTSWTDAGLGQIRTVAAGGGAAKAVTTVAGHYRRPRFSPDGKTIVFEQGEGGELTAPRGNAGTGVYRVAATGGAPVRVAKDAAAPQFGTANDRVFLIVNEGNKRQLVSTDLSGENRRVHAAGELVNDFQISPAGDYVAFRQNYEAFVMPLMPGTQAVEVDTKSGALPVTRVSADGADFINWSDNGKRLHWSAGPTLYSADTAALFRTAPADEDAAKFVAPRTGVSLSMDVAAAKPTGTVALTGARVVTMAGADGGIIDNATVLIRGDRIVAVGPRAAVQIPAGATTVDVTGKTIVPGFVDAHAHGPQGDDELVPQQNWSAMANLALGTTTVHDPSSRSAEIFPAAEMQQAGLVLAPRTFSTGEVIYGAKSPDVYAQIDSYDDALSIVRRLKAQGAHSVKNYNQPRREQRQMVVAAAQAEGMEVVPEGGSLYTLDMTLVSDGNSTLEHNVPLEHFYNDVLSLWAQTTVGYTPTLVVAYGGLAGDPYWRAHSDVWRHPLLTRHAPVALLAAQNARRAIAPEEDYVDGATAREAKKLADKGIPVAIGAHGQQPGLGAHWELWSFVRGGMTPIEALRAGTIASATSLGYQKDVGSLEPGKLADLVVLDADPTADIRNSDKISRVMLGGRLYEAATLNESATGNRKRLPYWWETGHGRGADTGAKLTTGHGHGNSDLD
ncbi:imidazolonepropionase-like amidohydrolase/Tol biopolymer transport system component [Sphingomonas endophytica]|uniref:Imidazolonepropionase-like amidohydrolase/Tol biopolymer transport system component n=1 Tax=Sphingomonas endophytica TaxID=869719 RepID=A0A7X0MPB4_9SPHN|nr:amidohydrolase family protein [Sphingomonas endophytica]MBB6504318.1 imidazolonepropionase-like amidohydrolase/Tol biopolymer transport system component [Sphingomonas endophytica]